MLWYRDCIIFVKYFSPHSLKGKKKVSPDKMVEMQAKIEEERKALETKLDMEEEERNKKRETTAIEDLPPQAAPKSR